MREVPPYDPVIKTRGLYRGTSLIGNRDFENGWVFLKELETFQETGGVSLETKRKFLPQKHLFLIRTISYERGTPLLFSCTQ